MLEGEILLDDAKLRSVAPSQAQHLGEIVEGDGALERRARQQCSIPSAVVAPGGAIPAARLDPGWHAGAYSLRAEYPCSLMRWAPCTMRSQIASAMVGSPITSCQDDTGSCETISAEARPWRSSRISSSAIRTSASSGSSAKLSMITRACFLSSPVPGRSCRQPSPSGFPRTAARTHGNPRRHA